MSGNRRRQTTIVAQAVIRDGRIEQAGFIPYVINADAQPLPASDEEAKDVLEELVRKSRQFDTAFDPRSQDILVLCAEAVGARPR